MYTDKVWILDGGWPRWKSKCHIQGNFLNVMLQFFYEINPSLLYILFSVEDRPCILFDSYAFTNKITIELEEREKFLHPSMKSF